MSYDDFSYSPTEDELIAMFAEAGGYGGLPGKTMANRLNLLQDVEQTLGVPLTQLLGLGPAQEDPTEVLPPIVSKQRAVYGSNPKVATMFDQVDAGNDPYTVVMAAKVTDPNEREFLTKIVTDYAFERSKMAEEQATREADAMNQMGTYSRPDGSKYKNTPLGGTDIMGFANEWELLGAPDSRGIMDSYVQRLAQQRTADQERRYTEGPRGPSNRLATDYTFANKYEADRFDETGSYTPEQKARKAKQDKLNASAPKVRPGSYTVAPSGETKDVMERVLEWELGKRKNTMVRSDANTNLMKRILGLRTLLGV